MNWIILKQEFAKTIYSNCSDPYAQLVCSFNGKISWIHVDAVPKSASPLVDTSGVRLRDTYIVEQKIPHKSLQT